MEILDEGFKYVPEQDRIKVALLKKEAVEKKRDILNGKITIYVIIGLNIINGLVGYFSLGSELLYVAIEIVFYITLYAIALSQLVTRPQKAFIIAICIFVFQQLINAILIDPTSFTRGFIVKGVILVYLVKAINAADVFQRVNNELNTYGEEVLL